MGRVLKREEDKEGQLEERVKLQLHRGTGEKVHYKRTADERELKHLDYPCGKYKKRKLCQLSTGEKIGIVHAVLVDHHTQAHVARLYRIGSIPVRDLIKKAKTNKKFLSELWT